MTRRCELCASEAKMYCESDRASLCWECDARVHSANFLVAKHSRTLLCRACHALTPWTGSGAKLFPTVSVCQKCLAGSRYPDKARDTDDDDDEEEEEEREQQCDYSEDDDDIEDDDEDCAGDCIEEDDDEENQVVPWSKPGQTVSRSDRECSKSESSFAGETSPSVSDAAFSWRSRFS